MKIVFSDIDRTLAIEGVVGNKNIEVIKRFVEDGNKFILVSGRTLTYAVDISKKVDASRYVICNNGAIVYDYKEDKIIYENKISFNIIKRLYELANKYNCRFILGTINFVYVNEIVNQNEILIHNLREIYNNNIAPQVTISSKNINTIKEIIEEVSKVEEIKILNRHRKLYDDTYVGNSNIWIDIAGNNVNKGIAITKLLEHLKFNLKDSVRIGDDLNDIPMFFDEGINVAVSNGVKELKDKADYVTASCQDNGVAKVLEKLMENTLQ